LLREFAEELSNGFKIEVAMLGLINNGKGGDCAEIYLAL
jgi:hypothetical protein